MTGSAASAGLALIGTSRGPGGRTRVDGVIGWAGPDGVVVPLDRDAVTPAALAELLGTGPVQLQLPLDDLPMPTSSGLTWATWALPSIPIGLRDQPLHAATVAVASSLQAVAA